VEEERDGKPWYFDIKRYVESKEYPLEASNNDKRPLRRLAADFFLSRSILYKRNHDMVLLRCVNAKEADMVLLGPISWFCSDDMRGYLMVICTFCHP